MPGSAIPTRTRRWPARRTLWPTPPPTARRRRRHWLRSGATEAGASPGAVEALGTAVDAVAGRAPLAEVETRLRSLEAELADAATELRQAHEHLEDDPARLAVVRDRRQLLAGLRRKYGDTLADVLAFAETARARRGRARVPRRAGRRPGGRT